MIQCLLQYLRHQKLPIATDTELADSIICSLHNEAMMTTY